MIKAKNVKSYLYGGSTRATAKDSVVDGNAVLEQGKMYYAPLSTGGLLTAIPVEGETDTEFVFEYCIDKTPMESDSTPMIIGIVVGVVALLIIICAIMKIRANKKDNSVQILA